MKKKLLGILVCLCMAMTLAMLCACGSSQTEESATTEESTSADGQEATATESEFTKAKAKIDEEMGVADLTPEEGEQFGLILSNTSNEFWATMETGAEDAAEEFGVKIDVQAAESDVDYEGQLNIVETMISKKYAALTVSPLSENNLVNGIADANKAGTKVILNGTLQDEDAMAAADAKVDGIMEMDFNNQGKMAGEFAAEKCGGQGQAAIIAGADGASNADGRRDGAKAAMEEAGMEVVAVEQCDWDAQKAYDATKSIMQANPDVKAITCGNDDMAMGVLKALDEMGISDVVVVGNDLTSEAKQSIKDGKLSASVAMSPYLGGRVSVITMIKAAAGEEVGTVTDYIPMILVSADNVDQMDDWK